MDNNIDWDDLCEARDEMKEVYETDIEIEYMLDHFIKRLYDLLTKNYPSYSCSSDERIAATHSMMYSAAKGAKEGLKEENVKEELDLILAKRAIQEARIREQIIKERNKWKEEK